MTDFDFQIITPDWDGRFLCSFSTPKSNTSALEKRQAENEAAALKEKETLTAEKEARTRANQFGSGRRNLLAFGGSLGGVKSTLGAGTKTPAQQSTVV